MMMVMNKVDFGLIEYFQVFSIDQNNQVIELKKKENKSIKILIFLFQLYQFDYFEDLNFLN
jgi:hypothetical protein